MYTFDCLIMYKFVLLGMAVAIPNNYLAYDFFSV